MRMPRPAAPPRGHVEFLRDVAVGVVGQKRCRADADDRAEQDVERDRIARAGRREQRRRDQWRRAAGDAPKRDESRAKRRCSATARVKHSAISAACGPYIMIVRDKGQHDREKDQRRHHRVHHREVDEGEHPDRDRADQIHPLAADAIRDVAGQRSRHRRQRGRDQKRGQQKVTRHAARPLFHRQRQKRHRRRTGLARPSGTTPSG